MATPAQAMAQYSFITGAGFGFGDLKEAAAFTCDHVDVVPSTPDPDPGLPGNADNPPDFVEGGPAVTRNWGHTGTVTNSSNAADKITGTFSGSTTAKLTGSGGNFTGFDITGTASAQVSSALGASGACTGSEGGYMNVDSVVTIAQPGWVTIELTGSTSAWSPSNPGYFYGGVYFQRIEPYVNANSIAYYYRDEYVGLESSSFKTKKAGRAYLLPGKYAISATFELSATLRHSPINGPTTHLGASTQAGTYHAKGTFQPAGAKDGAAMSANKGKKFVQLLDRSCATDTVQAQLKKKKLKDASKVVFSANGKKLKTVKLSKKFPKKGLVQVGPVADEAEVTVVATVFPKAKGTPKPSLTQDYLACS